MDLETPAPPIKKRRWLGVLLSLLVPGFGLARAGHYRRAIAWFLTLHLAMIILALILAAESVPFVFGFASFVAGIGLQIYMVVDSFRPGQMTGKHWGVFAVLLIVMVWAPTPAHFIAHPFQMPTSNMEPTLMGARNAKVADHVIVNRLSYLASKPRRGDLMVFGISSISSLTSTMPPGEDEVYYVKRVIGLPGEKIEIKDHSIYANGIKLDLADGLPPIPYVIMPEAKGNGVYEVGANEYFVLGDNSPNSYDSRFWGSVPEGAIYGKVTKIYYPLSRAGYPTYPVAAEEQADQ